MLRKTNYFVDFQSNQTHVRLVISLEREKAMETYSRYFTVEISIYNFNLKKNRS